MLNTMFKSQNIHLAVAIDIEFENVYFKIILRTRDV